MIPNYREIAGYKIPTFPGWNPNPGDMVYVARPDYPLYRIAIRWEDTKTHKRMLKRGLVFPHTLRGGEAAEQMSLAIISVITEGDDA